MTDTVDPSRCPLCQAPNACGMEAGNGTCWCMSVTIRPEVIEGVPLAARDRACVCAACAARALPVSAAAPAQE